MITRRSSARYSVAGINPARLRSVEVKAKTPPSRRTPRFRLLPGRVAPPLPDARSSRQLAVDWAAASQPIVVDAPPGALDLRRLAADVETVCDLRWVRLAPYEVDAAAVDALVDSIDRVSSPAANPSSRR